MKQLLFISFLVLPFLGLSQEFGCAWADGIGGFNGAETAVEAALDSQGNLYVAGTFESQTVLCGNTTLTNAGQIDILLVKYSPQGSILWAKRLGNTGEDVATGLCVDTDDNIYLTGHFKSQAISFGSTQLISNGSNDIFLAKLNPIGEVIWAKSAGGNNTDFARSVIADKIGNVYITGDFESDTIQFETIQKSKSLSVSDLFIAKFTSFGDIDWVVVSQIDDTISTAYSNDIAIDKDGNVAIAGTFKGSSNGMHGGSYIQFGPDSLLNNNIDTIGTTIRYWQTAFVAKFDHFGNYMRGYSDNRCVIGVALTSNKSNDFYVSLYFLKDGPAYVRDFSIIKLNSELTLEWRKEHDLGRDNVCTDIKTDSDNAVYATGYFMGEKISFETDTFTVEKVDGRYYHKIFLVKYNSFGEEEWVRRYGGTLTDKAACIVPFNDGDLYLLGAYESDTLYFDNFILFNESDTGTLEIHFGPVFHWRHSNVFIAQLTDEYFGIEDISSAFPFEVYPNPGSGFFSVKGEGIEEVFVYSVQGAMIRHYSFPKQRKPQSEIHLDIRNLMAGIYLVKVITKDGMAVRKIIKQ
ncbi:MAG: T9SS type A sorting domain-containing protein [Bacteroidales bacterium]|nr:T9SS type A sorting domain-containing protein [Bacteroidales bacterium]MCF8457273.1 T9SS type A sorting domain-containing protein [Bacteroidales bacterium]